MGLLEKFENGRHDRSHELSTIITFLARKDVNSMLYKAKENYYSTIIKDNAKDSKLLFRTVDKLLQKNNDKYYPPAKNDEELANSFADFFSTKIDNIRNGFINSHLEQYIVPGESVHLRLVNFKPLLKKTLWI